VDVLGANFKPTHLRPTAAFFLSDLHSKNALATMAMAQSIMEPIRVSGAIEDERIY
jgi:hypothetical protein